MTAEKTKFSIAESEATFSSMATPQFNHDILALIKSSQPLIYVTTHEESRFCTYMKHLSVADKRKCFVWDVYKGLVDIFNNEKVEVAGSDDTDPDAVLDIIISKIQDAEKDQDDNTKGSIYILLGFDRFLKPGCDPETERRLKHIVNINDRVTVILAGPSYASTESLDKDMSLLDFPYPNDDEIRNTLYHVLDSAKNKLPNAPKRVKENEEELIKACRGLTMSEAQQAYCKSVVMIKKTKKPEFDIPTILNEKKQIIRKNPILDFIDSNLKISDVGGLDPMVNWLKKRKMAFQENAKKYGLPYPKGAMLIGVAGCGKSLSAKAVASLYELPLLRLDFGKMFGSLVGESEKTCRDAIKLAESLAPCVSGESTIYDSDGNKYTIDEILNGNKKSLYVYSLNENTLRIEKTLVKAVIRHSEKKQMLRINTNNGNIKVTLDHKLLVNRDGSVFWEQAKDIRDGDLIMSSKYLPRDIKIFKWWESLKDDCYLSCEGQKYNVANLGDIDANNKPLMLIPNGNSEENLTIMNGVSLHTLYYLLGMIEAGGKIDVNDGTISFSSFDWAEMYHFSRCMQTVFGIEPSISGHEACINNVFLSKFLTKASEVIISQEDDVLAQYLGGVMDVSGVINYKQNSRLPKIVLALENTDIRNKLKSILHVFGVLAVSETKKSFVIASPGEIRKIIPYIGVEREDLREKISEMLVDHDFMIGPSKERSNFGYRLGSALYNDRNQIGIKFEDFACSPSTIRKLESKDSITSCELAQDIMETIISRCPEDVASKVFRLVDSDIIGVKVQSIEDVGLEYAYDLSCDKNHNFFANNFLCHNCILWCDEVEKGLSGTRSSGSTDGGTTSRVVSTFLTWLQEKTSPVFVICTANDAMQIPPEFMRAGRFDEVFFVDLPGRTGREQIFNIHIKRVNRDPAKFDLKKLSVASEGYSGAEIEKAVNVALFEGFADGEREIDTNDILNALKSFKPLSSTRKEEFDEMKKWAEGRCIVANTPDVSQSNTVNSVSNKKNIGLDF